MPLGRVVTFPGWGGELESRNEIAVQKFLVPNFRWKKMNLMVCMLTVHLGCLQGLKRPQDSDEGWTIPPVPKVPRPAADVDDSPPESDYTPPGSSDVSRDAARSSTEEGGDARAGPPAGRGEQGPDAPEGTTPSGPEENNVEMRLTENRVSQNSKDGQGKATPKGKGKGSKGQKRRKSENSTSSPNG